MSEAAVGTVTGETTSAAGNEAVEQIQETQAQEGQTQGQEAQKEVRAQETPQQRRARYEALVGKGGEFADLYREDTRRAVQGRLAETKKAMAAQQPVLELLMARYGVQDGDMGALKEAIEKDASWWQAYAEERGISEQQAREQIAMQAELEAMRRQHSQREGERRAQAQMRLWAQQSQEVQKVYPEFDLQAAMGSEDFRGMLKAGVSMKTAYEVSHMDDIKTAIARSAAKDAESRLSASIQANGARPVEGGASAQVGASTKLDPSKLSGKEVLALAERSAKGEKISFN